MDYFAEFERLTELMTSLDEFNIPEIFETLAKICIALRISKGVTSFYQSPEHEALDDGEHFVCYDSGEEHVLVNTVRLVTPAHIVIVCNVYQAKGAAPLTEQERRRVETIQRMMVTYVNRSRQEQIIQRLMYYGDDGFHNLRFFYAEIMRLANAGQIAGKTAIRINLKHFSVVNEQIGMEAGNVVMRRYCEALENAFHKDGIICRLGGDNFVALFETKYLPEVEKCLKGVPIPWDKSGKHRIEVSAVAGVYRILEQDVIEEPGTVMGRIVDAYSLAKREYNADIIYYRDAFQVRKEHEIQIQKHFREALGKEEFVVYFQPKVDIRTRELIGAEALCRWIRNGSIVPPLEFIPILERGLDICQLDFYMLNHVCMDLRRWLDEGIKPVRVSVNFSRRHMIDPDLFEHIIDIIDKNLVPHELIEIELTETTTDVEFKDLKRVVSQLQNAGICASVDDFGIGYSSLNLIKQIPWDVLKLDKSILPSNDTNDERSRRIFGLICGMANEIGLNCVAEGVETEEQLDLMKDYGCHVAQGFFFDKPLPVNEFENRLLTRTYA